jgi:DNA-binding XRE family transcriptional regulator
MVSKTHGAISEIVNPIRQNTLKERRKRLGLSRVALARILDVDPASIYRHEHNPMSALWDFALRGVEAEAAAKGTRQILRGYKSELQRENFMAEQLDARGHKYVAEKMNEARRQSVRATKPQGHKPQRVQSSDKNRVEAAVQRAIERADASAKRGAK